VSGLSDEAIAYLESRGVSEWDLSLLAEYAADFTREKDIAVRLGRNEAAVRKRFQAIRKRLGVENQMELAHLLGVLECFGKRT
jgi:hypothetical protein